MTAIESESAYQKFAESAFKQLEDLFADVDVDVVDCERAGDVLTLAFKNRTKCVVNTQRPTRQIWVAAGARAWHFSWDAAKDEWRDDKTGADELFATVKRIVKEQSGVDVA
jgi:CyaY protein